MGLFSRECTCTHDILKQQFDDYKAEISNNYAKEMLGLRSNLEKIGQTLKNNILGELQQKLEETLMARFSELEEKFRTRSNGKK